MMKDNKLSEIRASAGKRGGDNRIKNENLLKQNIKQNEKIDENEAYSLLVSQPSDDHWSTN